MRTVRQDFFDEFKCIADKCPATCCSGWQIMIDDASLERYENYSGSIPEKVAASIDFEEGAIRQDCDRNCAFLNKQGLCDWILSDGEDILCDTCRLYPRHVEEYEDLREWSVSLSCPEAARLYLSKEKPVEFAVEEDDEPDPLEEEFDEFDVIFFSKLLDARDALFSLARREDITFSMKLGATLSLSRKLQKLYDEDDVFMMDELIEAYYNKVDFSDISFDMGIFFRDNVELFDKLEVLNEEWEDCLEWLEKFDDASLEHFEIKGVEESRHELILSNLLMYFLYTYFPGAVYNGMIYGYAGMCVFGAMITEIMAVCMERAEDELVDIDVYTKLLYMYCRETEHSDLNIEEILKHFDAQV